MQTDRQTYRQTDRNDRITRITHTDTDADERLTHATVLSSMDGVRDLDVLLASELTMKQHVDRVASTCFSSHSHRLKQLKRRGT